MTFLGAETQSPLFPWGLFIASSPSLPSPSLSCLGLRPVSLSTGWPWMWDSSALASREPGLQVPGFLTLSLSHLNPLFDSQKAFALPILPTKSTWNFCSLLYHYPELFCFSAYYVFSYKNMFTMTKLTAIFSEIVFIPGTKLLWKDSLNEYSKLHIDGYFLTMYITTGSKNIKSFNICAPKVIMMGIFLKFLISFRLPSRVGKPIYMSNSIR